MTHELESIEDYRDLFDKFDTFLYDCDGVIWHGDNVIPGVADFLAYQRKQGKKLIFVTNNATKAREGFKAKFDKLGLEAHIEEIFGSAYASVAYLKYVLDFPKDKKVYVIGEDGLEKELESEGIAYCGGTDSKDNVFVPLMDFSSIQSDPDVGAVMAGFDMHINYKKIAKAHRYLQENKGCHFILTNDDTTFPHSDGKLYPGSGAISAPLRYAVKNKPIVVGKPNQPMLDCILKTHDIDRERTLMIGDRLDTDIAFGKNGGIKTLLVLTGVQKREDYQAKDAEVVPDYVIESLGDLSALTDSNKRPLNGTDGSKEAKRRID
ncbi:uncharacterized protein L969DRAFT_86460 [Mixia osmundae IAM 14324]|uniref:4-nitrophenylphosphatase n=1 Tax=Mixia osmundae (strain CBS 9802 / IAM 14324 / JCM 22182 / KY 12970) TaxID=764103 RepID=G7E9B7_MIXOS|nr:uncharacterized protein L969DRAFT_86460 [Mixia osmundae IAM 14324]KEI39863.1 hypothetical protein L969DRAFT_86460 [Mixia osmundae IAM 14324]GAA99236.1 hypothetical protein E5Q_05930 [Mixia osmundae IAM 14324]